MSFKSLTVPVLFTLAVSACSNIDREDPNAATKQGAMGGALLGMTMGALTGDAELAVKGAVAGGVAGGVAGSSEDLRHHRSSEQNASRDAAIASIGGGNTEQQLQQWQELENFVGQWHANIQNKAISGSIDNVSAEGTLSSLSSAEVAITAEQGLALNASFAFSPEQGHSLQLVNQATEVVVSFAGEAIDGGQRISFYPTDVDATIYQGIASSDVRIELSFAGNQVWKIDTYAFIEGSEQALQTFRFTKAG
ncbi:hypothetical protein [Aliagarivorans taiwanensis]|uniref:hypothetical protein n=1 Tax=Aliagarivorans taiwanensis TaxID=561966 RepID=UPI00040C1335|nr:hypothetical protein [Aliagarivorans taiwanensis]